MKTQNQRKKSFIVALSSVVIIFIGWSLQLAPSNSLSPAICFDLRRDKSLHNYSIIVSSRDADTMSHAFVSWIHHPQDRAQERWMWGFYAQAVNSYEALRAPKGELVDEEKILGDLLAAGMLAQRETRTAIVFWVNEDIFRASYEVVENWQPGKKYVLLSDDCVKIVYDILKYFQLVLPPRIYAPRPHDFIWGVIRLNSAEKHQCA